MEETMFIYVKTNENTSQLWTKDHFVQHKNPIIGLCMTEIGVAAHYLFVMIEKTLCRYPIREMAGSRVILRMYNEYNDAERVFKTTPKEAGTQHNIPENSFFFSSDEIAALKASICSGQAAAEKESLPYYSNSRLSKTQQDLLYFGIVTSTPCGMSFFDYIRQNILSLPKPSWIKISRAIVENDSGCLTRDEHNELCYFMFEFFAPNRINAFSSRLYDDPRLPHPTIGDVQDFFCHCLKKLLLQHHQVLPAIDTHLNNPTIRAIALGAEYDFQDDGMYNPQGLLFRHDCLFRGVIRIFELQAVFCNERNIKQLLTIPDFFSVRIELFNLICDIIENIVEKKELQLTQYIDIYGCIEAVHDKSNWSIFLPQLKIAKTVLLQLISIKDIILHSTFITEEKRTELLSFIHGKSYTTVHAEALLILAKANLLHDGIEKIINEPLRELKIRIALYQHKILLTLDEAISPELTRYLKKLENRSDFIKALTRQTYELVEQSKAPGYAAPAFFMIHKAGFATLEIITLLSKKSPLELTELYRGAKKLSEKNILTLDYFKLIEKACCPESMGVGLASLHEANLLTSDNIETLIAATSHEKKLSLFGFVLEMLQEAHLLTQERITVLKNHSQNLFFLRMIVSFRNTTLTTETHFDILKKHPNLSALDSIAFEFNREKPLYDKVFTALVTHHDATLLYEAIKELKNRKQENVLLLARHDEPILCAKVLNLIERYNSITRNSEGVEQRHHFFRTQSESMASGRIITALAQFTKNNSRMLVDMASQKPGERLKTALKGTVFWKNGKTDWTALLGEGYEPTASPQCCAMM